MEFTREFVQGEGLAAYKAAMRDGPLLKRPVVRVALASAGGLLLFGALRLIDRLPHLAVAPALQIAASLAVVVSSWTFVRRQRAATRRREENPDHGTLSQTGLEISGVDDLTLLPWSHMARVRETDRFFLFVDQDEVQFIPKRTLRASQLEAVRALIHRYAPPRSLLSRHGPKSLP